MAVCSPGPSTCSARWFVTRGRRPFAGKNEIRILLKSPTVYAWRQARKNGYRVQTDTDFKWQTGETRESRRSWIRKITVPFRLGLGALLGHVGVVAGGKDGMFQRSPFGVRPGSTAPPGPGGKTRPGPTSGNGPFGFAAGHEGDMEGSMRGTGSPGRIKVESRRE